MLTALTLACRVVLWASGKIVPASLLDDWKAEWAGGLWLWMLNAARAGDHESARALMGHSRRAFLAAINARFHTDPGITEVRRLIGNPRFCLTLCAAPLLLILIASLGLSKLRQFAHGLPYRNPDRVIVLAQGPPVFGVRLGFNDRELKLFADQSKTLDTLASYVWRSVPFATGSRVRSVQAAYVSDRFFEVLGSNTRITQPDEFLASYSFWKKSLRGDPNAVGQSYVIAGRPMRLAAVLPPGFTFLDAPIAVWLSMDADVAPPPSRWWLGLKGSVARLRSGVAPWQAENELHQLQLKASLTRRNFTIKGTPIRNLVYSELWSYSWDLFTALALVVAWAAGGFLLDRRRKMSSRLAFRYWGFFALKPILLLLALFCFLFEFTGVNALGLTGGLQNRGGPFLMWWSFIAAVIILICAWRDQPSRCRVCLHRMRQPLRIGIPGQILLETSGQEVLCPKGHGSVYTTESVLGSEISNRWMGFEEDAFK